MKQGDFFFWRCTKQLLLLRNITILIKPAWSITDAKYGRCTWSHLFRFLRQARNHMVMAGFSIRKNGRFFICGKRIDYNLYPYVVLTTKAKHRQLRRLAWRKNWATQHEGMCSHAFCHVTQNILLSCHSNCFVHPQKNSLTVSVAYDFFLFTGASWRLEPVIKCCLFLSFFQRLVSRASLNPLWQNRCHSDFTWGNRRHSRQRLYLLGERQAPQSLRETTSWVKT